MADSFQCMTKSTTIKKIKREKRKAGQIKDKLSRIIINKNRN